MSNEALAAARPAEPDGVLRHLPVAFFGSVMGLTGLSIAWRLAHDHWGLPLAIAEAIGAVAVLAFLALAVAYLAKLVTARDAVRDEFRHPIAGNLFGTVPISLLLLPIVLAPVAPTLARATWSIGAAGMVAFAWFTIDRWTRHRLQPAHATPAWIIPVVGLLDLPLAMPAIGLQSWHGPMVFGLAVGLFFTLPLFTLILSRLVFEDPLPGPLEPSLMILLAPTAVGTSTWIATTGHVDLGAESLFAVTLFLLAVLVGRLRHLAGCCPFRIGWWAVSFPLAAAAIAALRIAAATGDRWADGAAMALLGFASIVIAGLLVRTLVGLARGELRTLAG